MIRTMVRLALCVMLACGLCSTARGADAAQPAKQTLKVATFNINWGNPNLSEIARLIAAADADLVAVQEMNDQSERYLRRQLGKSYPYFKYRGPEGRYAAGGFGFLSRLPLANLQYVEAKAGLFGVWTCEVRIAGRPVQIVNVHLTPFMVPEEGGALAALRLFAKVEDVHAEEIKQVGGVLAKDRPAIVLGDFNSPSTFAAPQYLVKRGLADSFASVTKDADQHPTWHWPWGKTELRFCLDYIFHTAGITTAESRIVKTEASDHNLVVSKLEIPAK
jgi:endonuclease/exonuclease/phosphatase family metal-dependent hydrolase